jgi:L-asparaginase
MGGTIEFFDPAYEAINRKLMKLDTTVDSYLKNLIQPHFSFSSESIVKKDSREITEADRIKLVNLLLSSPHHNIIVTHGTFTMWQTGQYLEQCFSDTKKLQSKKIILTGSMIPIAGFSISDAGFNLGFTIASFSSVEPGVYMSMNGGIFHIGEKEKNETLLRFE